MRKFRRAPGGEQWLGGVCSGVAYATGAPIWAIRLAWFLATWFYGVGGIAYLLLAIFAPRWAPGEPADTLSVTRD